MYAFKPLVFLLFLTPKKFFALPTEQGKDRVKNFLYTERGSRKRRKREMFRVICIIYTIYVDKVNISWKHEKRVRKKKLNFGEEIKNCILQSLEVEKKNNPTIRKQTKVWKWTVQFRNIFYFFHLFSLLHGSKKENTPEIRAKANLIQIKIRVRFLFLLFMFLSFSSAKTASVIINREMSCRKDSSTWVSY